ncbi:HotDog domain-containing protein [Podospora australis]|uniref:HotDog domain-containing protein n=1 Tax=Podospora australis TaxID=1536484 RepID=A0AAN6WTV6_9PEZI|nr:HotDog domain-containing protein [Podospora australis]
MSSQPKQGQLPTVTPHLESNMKTITSSPANLAQQAHHIAYFRSIPWCASLLDHPDIVISQSVSRVIRPLHNMEDALISQTLNRTDAIPAYITFYSPPSPSSGALVKEVSSLIALGPMVNGWDGICHGGIVMTLLDEVMGQLFAVNKQRKVMKKEPLLTGWLKTKFLKPVYTGTKERANVVLVVAKLTEVEGRKHATEAVVYGEDGTELARADAMFVQLRPKGSKL